MLITELFQTANVKTTWTRNSTCTFTIDETNYTLFIVPVTKGDMWHKPISKNPALTPIEGESFFLGFMASDKNNSMTDKTIGGKKSIIVFSVVIQELQKWVAKNAPKRLYFGADSEDSSRMSLYKRLVQRFTSNSKWVVIGEGDGNYQGPKHLWILKPNDVI